MSLTPFCEVCEKPVDRRAFNWHRNAWRCNLHWDLPEGMTQPPTEFLPHGPFHPPPLKK